MYWTEYFRSCRTCIFYAVVEYSAHRGFNVDEYFLRGLPIFFVILVTTSTWFYWIHRWQHENEFLWKYVHKQHHESWNVGPLSSGSSAVQDLIMIYFPMFVAHRISPLFYIRLLWRFQYRESL